MYLFTRIAKTPKLSDLGNNFQQDLVVAPAF